MTQKKSWKMYINSIIHEHSCKILCISSLKQEHVCYSLYILYWSLSSLSWRFHICWHFPLTYYMITSVQSWNFSVFQQITDIKYYKNKTCGKHQIENCHHPSYQAISGETRPYHEKRGHIMRNEAISWETRPYHEKRGHIMRNDVIS